MTHHGSSGAKLPVNTGLGNLQHVCVLKYMGFLSLCFGSNSNLFCLCSSPSYDFVHGFHFFLKILNLIFKLDFCQTISYLFGEKQSPASQSFVNTMIFLLKLYKFDHVIMFLGGCQIILKEFSKRVSNFFLGV